MSEVKHRRSLKNYFVFPALQAKLLGLIVSLCLITPICMFLFQFGAYSFLYNIGIENNWPASHSYFVFLEQFQELFYLVLVTSVSISLIFAIVMGVIVTHQIAGPMKNLVKHLDSVADGKTPDTEIHFRDGDFFHEVAIAYNKRFKRSV